MTTAILIILDGLGVGGAPDAAEYGDLGSDTLGNMARQVGGLMIPHLASLGLGNLAQIQGVAKVAAARGCYARLQEISSGKDSTTGHWELMGVVTETPFPTYPNGFPVEVIEKFTRLTGYGVIGNIASSGTTIIESLGDEHIASGQLIVYTSGDSVFQIAAHESVCDIKELYRVCEIARKMLKPPHNVGRVIARPFSGQSGNYQRTPFRHDYSIHPPAELLLPKLKQHGVEVSSIGKIYDLYAGAGIEHSHRSLNNAEGMENLTQLYHEESSKPRLLLLNLVDFDMLWGHRNDPQGMKKGLETFDLWLGGFLNTLQHGDLLMMTADHGNDPTTASTDHSREHVPLLAFLAGSKKGEDLGVRKGFMDVGATIAEYFNCSTSSRGISFYPQLLKSV